MYWPKIYNMIDNLFYIDCVDILSQIECEKDLRHCNAVDGSPAKNYMQKNCKKTCGLCQKDLGKYI